MRPILAAKKSAEQRERPRSGRNSPRTGSPAASRSARLEMTIESPPLVFYGTPNQSTGALLSGQLRVRVQHEEVKLVKFEMRLFISLSAKKPVDKHCPDCSTKTTELSKWVFLTETKTLNKGNHDFPFSYLLPGHLPISTHGVLGVLEYHLSAVATTSTGEKLTYDGALDVMRAVFPGNIKTSIRVFPPTDIIAHVVIPPVLHPIGEFTVEMRLCGISKNDKDTQVRWKLRKLSWTIVEDEKMISPACSKHAHKVGGEGKGIQREEARSIGNADFKDGWKTDFQAGDIEFEFKANVNVSSKPSCDVESPTGLSVKHTFIIEMVVAEEYAPLKRPNQATPTGAARVMRMQFNVLLTQRSGLGISWDEEQPPVYEDVPGSPPHYAQMLDYDGPPLALSET